RGAQAVEPIGGTDVIGVAQAAAWGLTRVLGQEIPDLRCTLTDLDPSPSRDDAATILRTLAADDRETQLGGRDGRLFAPRLRPTAPDATRPPPEIRSDGTYLITGGLGGLGLAVTRWLVEHGARSLVLTGRRGPNAEAQAALAELHRS